MAPLATFAQKFGKVNTQTIMQALPDIAKVNGELQAQQKTYENDLKGMQDELTRQNEAYEKGKSTMNPTQQKQKEQELQTLYQKIQQTYQDNSQAMQKLQQEKISPITDRLVNAIKAVGKAGGYVYIMDVTSGVPYISETLSKDVTAEVKAELQKTVKK